MNKEWFQILKKSSPTMILIFVLLYFGNIYMQKIEKIETELLSIRLELTKIQTTIVPASELQNQMKELINTHERIYHNKKD